MRAETAGLAMVAQVRVLELGRVTGDGRNERQRTAASTMSFFLAGNAADADYWEMQRRAAERLLVGGFERGATLGPIHRKSPV